MKKKEVNDGVLYTIAWSPLHKYDKYSITKIIPELPGIVLLMENVPRNQPRKLLYFSCWRDGLRIGLKNLMDPIFTRHPALSSRLQGRDLYYMYTVVDTTPRDMQDILWWLIQTYKPELNDNENYTDSQRFTNISVREEDLPPDAVVERLSSIGR